MAQSDRMIYDLDLAKVPTVPGIYVFGRRWGRRFEALYVGKTEGSLQARVKRQLNNVKLMQHVRNARNGRRALLAGKIVTKGGRTLGGRRLSKCVKLAERAFIRHFLLKGHDLVNTHGTRLRRHEVTSAGRYPKRYFPKDVHLERSKGE